MMGKGFAYAAVGAVIGAVVWAILIRVTGSDLWILAPIVGGCAGFGMMRGTQMRGGLPAGVLAAGLTLAAILATRYIVVSGDVEDQLAFDEAEIVDEFAYEVADEWAGEGYEVYDEEGDFLPAVYEEAQERWAAMSDAAQREYITALEGQSDEMAAVLTPLGLLFDFGIFGTICAALAAGCAFKTASITLEEALVDRGHAVDADDAQALATDLRGAGAARERLNQAASEAGEAG